MKRLMSLLLLLATLALGLALAAQDGGGAESEVGGEVDANTPVEAGPEVDPAAEQEGAAAGEEAAGQIDAASIETEAEADAAFDALAAQGDQAEWPNSTSQFLATQEDLSIFLMLLEQAGMTETLAEGDRPITIFAPNDSAFAGMDPLEFSTMVDDPARLRSFLESHIATDTYSLADISTDLASTVTGGGPGEKAASAGVDVDAAGAGGDDGVIDVDAADAANDQADMESVAGGGPAGDSSAATVTTPDPSSFVRLDTRSGADIEIGTRPATVRAELMQQAESDADGAAAVAGGGPASDAASSAGGSNTFYVGDAQIVTADLGVEDATIHVIDRVLVPPQAEDAAAQ